MIHSALYQGWVSHRRLGPVPHSFHQRVAMCYLDLDELPAVLRQHPLWSARSGHPVQFRRSDYLGDPSVPLAEATRRTVSGAHWQGADGPIRVLTLPRTWGWCFNPISLYFCFDPSGGVVRTVVASVTNTPWGDRHDYVLGAGKDGRVDVAVDKELHVSPFLPMGQSHRFEVDQPAERIRATVENRQDGQVVFRADLRMQRRPLDRAAMTALVVRYPAMTWRVSAGIYWQAARLAMKGAPFHRHPDRGGHP